MCYYMYLPNPSAKQGHFFFSWVALVWIQSIPIPKPGAIPRDQFAQQLEGEYLDSCLSQRH